MAEQEWTLDAKARVRIDRALEKIEEAQSRLPVCPCGQRTSRPSGICGKTTAEHAALVAESRWKT